MLKRLCSLLTFFVCLLVFSSSVYPKENIRVLILNETYPNMPSKDEKIVKLGSLKGDLLVMGSRYSGNIDVWRGEKGLYIINELPLEEYVKDVVSAEVGPDWDMEALKAQAVVSRTYALYQKSMNGKSIFHIASSVIHQVYKGNSQDTRIAHAVEETKGEILTYNSKLIEAFYHSTCGGRTENPEEVFGRAYPYLRSLESNCDISPYWIWNKTIQIMDIEKALGLSQINKISIKSLTSTGRVKQLEIEHGEGITLMNATDLRKALGWKQLPSTHFNMVSDGDSISFEGKGYGHGVGLCQWSALLMARDGKNYREILSFFYPGTVIQLEFYETH